MQTLAIETLGFAPRALTIREESAQDFAAREALLDRAMGSGRIKKSSEKLRRHRLPAEGLALVAHDEMGAIIGSVRLWHVLAGATPALLLGPLAVAPEAQGAGIGGKLMRRAIAEAAFAGHRAILLVGDAPYYARFGFTAELTQALDMPGPVDRARFLGLELQPGALQGATGMLTAAGAFAPRRAVAPVARAA
ncbi:MAG: GNAT family N-acetyltransferase [Bosea sp. (in: a-proteobacteria)]